MLSDLDAASEISYLMRLTTTQNPYVVLRVDARRASIKPDLLRKRYHKLMKLIHPAATSHPDAKIAFDKVRPQ